MPCGDSHTWGCCQVHTHALNATNRHDYSTAATFTAMLAAPLACDALEAWGLAQRDLFRRGIETHGKQVCVLQALSDSLYRKNE